MANGLTDFRVALCLIIVGLLPAFANAHEMRPGYLEIREGTADTYDVLWKVPALGDDMRLGLYLRFGDDVKIVTEPVAGFIGGAHTQRMRIQRAGGLTGTTVTIDGLDATFTDVLLRLEWADGTEITHRLTPAAPSYIIEAEPVRGQVAWIYLALGTEHILLGVDHLLFVLALLMVVVGWRILIGTITAFTVAHSITLALAALGFVHVPGPPVEAIIALSIVFVAAESVRGRTGKPGLTARMPWRPLRSSVKRERRAAVRPPTRFIHVPRRCRNRTAAIRRCRSRAACDCSTHTTHAARVGLACPHLCHRRYRSLLDD